MNAQALHFWVSLSEPGPKAVLEAFLKCTDADTWAKGGQQRPCGHAGRVLLHRHSTPCAAERVSRGAGDRMTVYVDDMRAPFGRMVLCHMLADTDDELHAMADRIGVARRWHQGPPTHVSHYDISLSKRALAEQAGAVEITYRQCATMNLRSRATGLLGAPGEAWEWLVSRRSAPPDVRHHE